MELSKKQFQMIMGAIENNKSSKEKYEDLISEEEAMILLGWTKGTMWNNRVKKLSGCYVKLPGRKYLYSKSKILEKCNP